MNELLQTISEMSWLFGMNKGQAGNPPQFPLPPFPPDGDDKGGKDDKSKMEAYRFDSAALERAAKAAKDLESTSKKKKRKCILLPLYMILTI